MNPYLVTGCIVTYNNMKTINNTLSTIFKHTKDIDFKLYVVDNGSVDGTVDFIKEKYPQVEVIVSPGNIGFGKGHNFILDRLDSKYHFIINPDILMLENSILNICEYFDANNDIGLISPKILNNDGSEQILGKRNPRLKYLVASRLREHKTGKLLREYAMLDSDLSSPVDIENTSGCFIGIRTELFKKVGGFDKRYFMYFEDADLARESAKHMRVIYYPNTCVKHVWNRGSSHHYKLMLIHVHSMLKYFAKWKTI